MGTTAQQRIAGAVGDAGLNKPTDVIAIQRLLNGHLARDHRSRQLAVDGKMSTELLEAITSFQIAGDIAAIRPGRVEPGSPTLWMLNQRADAFGYERRRMRLKMSLTMTAPQQSIEVFVFDAVMSSPGSQFGHAAIDIDGTTYSRAHTKYAKLGRDDYITSNLTRVKRDVVSLTLRVTRQEKAIIKAELDKRVAAQAPYDIAVNSCSTNVADVLEKVGILAHDPRFQLMPSSTKLVTPKELLIILSRSDRLIKRTNYSKSK